MMLDTIDAVEEYQPADTGQELIRFMNEWCEISARRDIAALNRMLAGDLVITTFDGRVLTKREYLDTIESMPADFRLTASEQKAQILADTGIVRAIFRVEIGGKEIHLRTTATFVKRVEKWVVVAVHSNVLQN